MQRSILVDRGEAAVDSAVERNSGLCTASERGSSTDSWPVSFSLMSSFAFALVEASGILRETRFAEAGAAEPATGAAAREDEFHRGGRLESLPLVHDRRAHE